MPIFGDIGVFIAFCLGMTLAYPVKILTLQDESQETSEQTPAQSQWKLGLEVGAMAPPLVEFQGGDFTTAGVAVERSIGPGIGLAVKWGKIVSQGAFGDSYRIGLPITLLGAYDAWRVPKMNFMRNDRELLAEYAYLFLRPEIGFLKYKVHDTDIFPSQVHQGSLGLSLGSGYRFSSDSATHYWVQSWVGYQMHSNVGEHRQQGGGQGGFDMGMEF